ncbi:hypothetical protein LTR05_003734 [Lithohypha guttulata]|uniref:LYR motif-containing protein Cup1-like N-terminal domain-containing protein n=1 Tax=Lithohypha guttulata TaxID=1690604 RepID=A0AAN7YH02_9EURO|nr:hypothetical protein LTR05_003734 [Lithohypha guttulata]
MNTPYRNPLHLYRALLREAGYLFDSASQDFHTQHIRCSFRRQKDRRDATQHGESSLPSQELSHQLKRGRKYLYMLQRANEGYSGAVKNVLKATYALKGKRRRNMMKELMIPQSVESAEYSKDWQPPPKFTMIMNCQSKVHRFLEAGKLIPPPVIPDKNKQQKPFPKVRIKGIIKRWQPGFFHPQNHDRGAPPVREKFLLLSTTTNKGQLLDLLPWQNPVHKLWNTSIHTD